MCSNDRVIVPMSDVSASVRMIRCWRVRRMVSGILELERKWLVADGPVGSLKIWNLKTGACIRTMECGYAICCTFLPGDRHVRITGTASRLSLTLLQVLVGTKSGHLELFDLASSSMLESIQAHTAAIWGMDLRADKGGLVTCSADKDVKFWDIRTKQVESGPGSRIITRLGEERVIKTSQIGLAHVKTLKMTDDVLAVKYSPDGRLLAVSLLDSTVKVFFQDTLKFFLSLYGHKVSFSECNAFAFFA